MHRKHGGKTDEEYGLKDSYKRMWNSYDNMMQGYEAQKKAASQKPGWVQSKAHSQEPHPLTVTHVNQAWDLLVCTKQSTIVQSVCCVFAVAVCYSECEHCAACGGNGNWHSRGAEYGGVAQVSLSRLSQTHAQGSCGERCRWQASNLGVHLLNQQ